jgi:transcriptional regulator with XRE-family HTH domain
MSKHIDARGRLTAQRIRAARLAYGWTLAELRERLPESSALSISSLSRIELAQRTLDLSDLGAIADALGISAAVLMRDGKLCETCGQEIPE